MAPISLAQLTSSPNFINYFASQTSKKPSLISARLKASHGTSSPNMLLTLADYGQKYEETVVGNARLHFSVAYHRSKSDKTT